MSRKRAEPRVAAMTSFGKRKVTVPNVTGWPSRGWHNSTRVRYDELADGGSASHQAFKLRASSPRPQGAHPEMLISVRVAGPKIFVYATA